MEKGKPQARETSPKLGRGFILSIHPCSTHITHTCFPHSPPPGQFFFLMVISAKSQKQKRMFCPSKVNVCVSNLQRILTYPQQLWVEREDETLLLTAVTTG